MRGNRTCSLQGKDSCEEDPNSSWNRRWGSGVQTRSLEILAASSVRFSLRQPDIQLQRDDESQNKGSTDVLKSFDRISSGVRVHSNSYHVENPFVWWP